MSHDITLSDALSRRTNRTIRVELQRSATERATQYVISCGCAKCIGSHAMSMLLVRDPQTDNIAERLYAFALPCLGDVRL